MKLSKLLISMFSLLLLLSLTSVMDIRVLGDAHAQPLEADPNLGKYGGLVVGVPREDVGTVGNAGGVLFSTYLRQM